MKGDFSRNTFDPRKQYTGVRLQQGRVTLDADFNEQADIVQHLLRTQIREMLGASGTSQAEGGFEIRLATRHDSGASSDQTGQAQDASVRPEDDAADEVCTNGANLANDDNQTCEDNQTSADAETALDSEQPAPAQPAPARSTQQPPAPQQPIDIIVSAGLYFVDGILCENENDLRMSEHPERLGQWRQVEGATRHLVFLDVWQRDLTANEEPSIREVALTGSDTSTRTKTIWQLGFLSLESDDAADAASDEAAAATDEVAAAWQVLLQTQQDVVRLEAQSDAFGMAYENHLYRVEVHDPQRPSFKWSRDNGCVAFRVAQDQGVPQFTVQQPGELKIDVEHLGRRAGELNQRDLIEIIDDESIRSGRRRALCQIELIDAAASQLTLLVLSSDEESPDFEQAALRALENPVLIRWDHERPEDSSPYDGALTVQRDQFLPIERGISVRFSREGALRAGDYWTIPARVQRSGIEWPPGESRPPEGINHHYSPLAIIKQEGDSWEVERDLRPKFLPQVEIPETLDDLEKRLRDEHDATTGRLEARIAALEKAMGLQYCHSDCALVHGDVVARVPDTVDLVERVNPENARLVAGIVGDSITTDGRTRFRIHTRGEHEMRVVGPIRPGDLLVPSDRAGRVCRAGLFIRPGTLIAKAVTAHHADDLATEGFVKGIIVFG